MNIREELRKARIDRLYHKKQMEYYDGLIKLLKVRILFKNEEAKRE